MHINMAMLGIRIIWMIFTITRSQLVQTNWQWFSNYSRPTDLPIHFLPVTESNIRAVPGAFPAPPRERLTYILPPTLGLVCDCLWPMNLGEWADAARTLGALEGFRLAFALLRFSLGGYCTRKTSGANLNLIPTPSPTSLAEHSWPTGHAWASAHRSLSVLQRYWENSPLTQPR